MPPASPSIRRRSRSGLAFLTPVLVWLKVEFGWPSVFFVTGTLGLFWSFVFFRSYRDPAEHPHVNAAEIRKIADSGGIPDLSRRSAAHRAANKGSVLRDLGIVLGRRKLWGIYFGHFVWGTVGTFFRTWFPTYLVTYRHFTFIKAGFYISLPFLAVFVGVLVLRRGVGPAGAARLQSDLRAQGADHRRPGASPPASSAPTTWTASR